MSLYANFVEQPTAGPAATWIALQPDIWLWQPHLRPLDEHAAQRESTASTLPWSSIVDPTPQRLTIALSQLANLSWVAGTDATHLTLRVCEGDWAVAEEFPVALGFGPPTTMSTRGALGVPTDPASPSSALSAASAAPSSATQAHLKSLPMAQVLPPPTLGHVALLARDGEWQPLVLDLLDEAAAAVQRELSAALLDLAAPGNWYAATDLLALCALPSGYERKREELRAASLATQGHARDQFQRQLEALEEARDQVDALRSAALAARRDVQGWQERLGAARILAQRQARPAPHPHVAAAHGDLRPRHAAGGDHLGAARAGGARRVQQRPERWQPVGERRRGAGLRL